MYYGLPIFALKDLSGIPFLMALDAVDSSLLPRDIRKLRKELRVPKDVKNKRISPSGASNYNPFTRTAHVPRERSIASHELGHASSPLSSKMGK